jgi:hypothetical protein
MTANLITKPTPLTKAHKPVRDGALTVFESSAPVTASVSVAIDCKTGLSNTINGKTLVTKGQFLNSLDNYVAYPCVVAAECGLWSGNVAATVLPILTVRSERETANLLNIHTRTTIAYNSNTTQIALFGWNDNISNLDRLYIELTLPAGVSLSSLKLFFSIWDETTLAYGK